MSKKFIDFYLDAVTAKKDSGGGGSATLINKDINANGTYNASSDNADGYKKVVVNVPNSYAAGDEGKVVSNGALVAQTAHAKVTQNGTIDTTLNNSVEVDVPTGGGGENEDAIVDRSISGAYTNNRITKVGTFAFAYCPIEEFNSTSATEIENSVFTKCTNLESANIPNACSVGDSVFYNCTALESVDLSSATGLGNGVFNGCGLLDIDLPEVLTMGNTVFNNCASLTSVVLSKCTSMGYNCFQGCTSLTELVIETPTVCATGTTPFGISVPTNLSIYVPDNLVASYKSATNWSASTIKNHIKPMSERPTT